MLSFVEDQWVGNRWMSIEINPVDMAYLLPILWHLSSSYQFEMPKLVDTLDGYAADFEILDSKVTLMLDNWSFSIAFEKSIIRDHVLTELRALPADYFPNTADRNLPLSH